MNALNSREAGRDGTNSQNRHSERSRRIYYTNCVPARSLENQIPEKARSFAALEDDVHGGRQGRRVWRVAVMALVYGVYGGYDVYGGHQGWRVWRVL